MTDSSTVNEKNRSRKGFSPKRRLAVVFLITVAMFTAVILRLGYLQVVAQERYDTIGESQRIRSVKMSADRGAIFDRNGIDLAQSVPQQTIWADPALVEDPFMTAATLAPILGIEHQGIEERIRAGKRFAYIARTVTDEKAAQVKALKLPGIAAYEEPKRFLPGDNLLKPVLGKVGIDNEGLSGLELQYEEELKGRPGRMRVEQDPAGRQIAGGYRGGEEPKVGNDLVLTIDRDLQYKVEEALTAEIGLANARGGIAVIMDTKTGEILALANLQVPDGKRGGPVGPAPSNSSLTNVYEPGSVSKLITMSAALEVGIVNPNTVFSLPSELKVADAVFGEAEPRPPVTWTSTDIIAASSNVGTILVGQKLGKDRLDQYQRAFGYGSTTGLDFPGESQGLMLDPKKYSGTSLATTAIGQGVSVTAVQMVGAFNTIANGGTYVTPKLVKATVDSEGKVSPTEPSPTRQVVSPTTAAQMNLMMQEVVRVGTATAAQIDGYSVAGKTGTARKPRTDGIAGYEFGAYISSFAGFVPAEDPRLTAMVILDQPTPIYGGLVAAPVFADISRYALQRFGIEPADAAKNRFGVPYASPTVSQAASESSAGLSAGEARAVTASVNKSAPTTTTTAPGTAGGAITTVPPARKQAPTSTPSSR